MIPQKKVIDEIRLLHEQFVALSTEGIKKAFRIGELLTEQKALLQHGEWIPWIEQNMPFNRVTAANYMRLFRNKAALNVQGVVHLAEAYQVLAGPARYLPALNEDETNNIPDEVMEMCSKLEEMNEGEILTGYAHYEEGEKKKYDYVTIRLLSKNDADLSGDDLIYYEFVNHGESETIHAASNEMTVADFILYMSKQIHIKLDGITWMYPGIRPIKCIPKLEVEAADTITFHPDNA
jgi:hypothetical protein